MQLFQGTVRDNVTLFDRDVPDARLVEVFAELGLGEWLSALPAGLDTPLGAGGRGLSAGEAQLLAFARVFLRDPGLVVLDEASSRLDPATERLLERAVTRLLDGRTAIVIAHRLATVERADRGPDAGRRAGRRARGDGPTWRRRRLPLRPAAARRRAGGGAGVRPLMRALWRLVRFSPGYFALASSAPSCIYFCLPIPLGLATRAFFDALWPVSRPGSTSGARSRCSSPSRWSRWSPALCSRNPWAQLQQPARRCCAGTCSPASCAATAATGWPVSAGEAISRFRDDPERSPRRSTPLIDLIGRTFFAAGALVVMWRDQPDDHVALFVPLLLVLVSLTEALGNGGSWPTATRRARRSAG